MRQSRRIERKGWAEKILRKWTWSYVVGLHAHGEECGLLGKRGIRNGGSQLVGTAYDFALWTC